MARSSRSREKRPRKRGIVPQNIGSGSVSFPSAETGTVSVSGIASGAPHEPPQRRVVLSVAAVAVVDDPRGAVATRRAGRSTGRTDPPSAPGELRRAFVPRAPSKPGASSARMERVPAHLEQDVAGDAALDPRRPWRPRLLDERAQVTAAVAVARQREHGVGAEVGDGVRESLERRHRPRRVADDVEGDVEAVAACARRRCSKSRSIPSQFARPIGFTCAIWSRQPARRAQSRAPRPSPGRRVRRSRACGRRRGASRAAAIRVEPLDLRRARVPAGEVLEPDREPDRSVTRPSSSSSVASAAARSAWPAAGHRRERSARSVLCPTKMATLSGRPRRSTSARYSLDGAPVPAEVGRHRARRAASARSRRGCENSPSGAGEMPQLPATDGRDSLLHVRREQRRRRSGERRDPVEMRVDVDEPRRGDQPGRVDRPFRGARRRRPRRSGRPRSRRYRRRASAPVPSTIVAPAKRPAAHRRGPCAGSARTAAAGASTGPERTQLSNVMARGNSLCESRFRRL